MKKFAVLLLTLGLIGLYSCKDDDGWISMSAIESAVWIEINEFRTDSGKVAVAANYDTMVEQAKFYSGQMASGNQAVDESGLMPVWDIIHDRWGGTNEVDIISMVQKGSSDISVEDIIDPIKEHPNTAEALLSDVSIGGVGIVYDTDGNAYVTILMMKVE